jgi:hypothetical protein
VRKTILAVLLLACWLFYDETITVNSFDILILVLMFCIADYFDRFRCKEKGPKG